MHHHVILSVFYMYNEQLRAILLVSGPSLSERRKFILADMRKIFFQGV
jgi:hypothetical protein